LRVLRTEKGGYFVRDEAVIREIVQTARAGHYCTILGPSYSLKTVLLTEIQREVQASGDEACVFLNLRDLTDGTPAEFLQRFASAVREKLHQAGVPLPPEALGRVADRPALQAFLHRCLSFAGRDVILLLNRLQTVPMRALESLLLVLRAIYNERGQQDPHRLGVITASTLNVAELALGPGSPFNVAHLFWVEDLNPAESRLLFEHIVREKGAAISDAAIDRLFQAARGDRYLMPRLCQRCAETVPPGERIISPSDVEEAIQWFLDERAQSYGPLQQTVNDLESDPVALLNALDVLEAGCKSRSELRVGLGTEFDALRLSGAVRVEQDGDRILYHVRNEVYGAYLRRRLFPEWVVGVLTDSGRLDEAVAYLEHLGSDSPRLRSLLTKTVLRGIAAARDEGAAYTRIAQSLVWHFGAPQARVYQADSAAGIMRMTAEIPVAESGLQDLALDGADGPECEAFRSRQPWPTGPVKALPLSSQEGLCFGVVSLPGFEPGSEERWREVQAFVQHAGWAAWQVAERERERRTGLPEYEKWSHAAASLDLDQVVAATIEGAMGAVPKAEAGALFLWDPSREKLIIAAQRGMSEVVLDRVQLARGQGYVGWVYANGRPLILSDVRADPRTVLIPPVDERSACAVPLEGWGRTIGVLWVHSQRLHAFQLADLQVLCSFAAQAALAIRNARFTTELFELGMKINQTGVTERAIFSAAVQSIIRVCGAKSANMLLLRNTDNPGLCVEQRPRLSVSEGLPPGFENTIGARTNGMTAQVLKTRKPVIVSQPDEPPQIHPLAAAQGVQSSICLPLIVNRQLIGVLFVHYEEPHRFSEHEIRVFSVYANQTALAIQNAQQLRKLSATATVAWMGIGFSNIAHRITQKVGAMQNTLEALEDDIASPAALERIGRIKKYAAEVLEVPRSALLPSNEAAVIDLNALLRQEAPMHCTASWAPHPDFAGLAAHPVEVLADSRWLKIVIRTLTDNAVRAMEYASERKLAVETRVLGDEVEVRFTNSGKPVPDEVQKTLFQKPVPRSSGAEGTGVGLIIAQSIVNSYGGEIWLVESVPGRTTIAFNLPLRPSAPA
jgi:GAF domain-containing protein